MMMMAWMTKHMISHALDIMLHMVLRLVKAMSNAVIMTCGRLGWGGADTAKGITYHLHRSNPSWLVLSLGNELDRQFLLLIDIPPFL